MWYLEKNKLISPIQNGFRKNRSTIDHLVRFESLLREASIKNLHTVAIFFDIEKHMILPGNMAYYVSKTFISKDI